jgi:hypothetical protein
MSEPLLALAHLEGLAFRHALGFERSKLWQIP